MQDNNLNPTPEMSEDPMMPVTPTESTKISGGALAGIIGAIALIVMVAVAAIILLPKNEGGTSSGVANEETAGKSEEQIRKDDKKRKKAVDNLLIAINSYQSNNNGKTPFMVHYSGYMMDSRFVSRYIDADCTMSADEVTYVGCSETFTDPDGAIYSLKHVGVIEADDENPLAEIEKLDYTFYAYSAARCDGDEGVLLGLGQRQVAVLMRLESGAVYCADNY